MEDSPPFDRHSKHPEEFFHWLPKSFDIRGTIGHRTVCKSSNARGGSILILALGTQAATLRF